VYKRQERRFAERGFDGASVREIAADVGLKNQASLYHHFDNKQALYEAVLARGVDLLIDVVEESARAGSLRHGGAAETVGAYVGRVVTYLVAHPNMARLIQRASLDDDAAAREIVLRLVRPLFDGGVSLLRESGDTWPADEIPHVAAGIYHLIFGYFVDTALLRGVMHDDPSSDEAVERQRKFLRTAIPRLLGIEDRDALTEGDTR
jgi:AcrR family transcriptional regulator